MDIPAGLRRGPCVRVLLLMLALVAGVGCSNKDGPRGTTAPAPANVILKYTSDHVTSTGCMRDWGLKNVGGSTAYHVWVHTTAGDYWSNVPDLAPGEEGFARSVRVSTGCPALLSINWSPSP